MLSPDLNGAKPTDRVPDEVRHPDTTRRKGLPSRTAEFHGRSGWTGGSVWGGGPMVVPWVVSG